MSLLRRFLSKDNLSKYEKEQKKRYKQYVKLGTSNTVVLSKTETEIYQDYFVRKKSVRRSKKKFSRKEDQHDIFKEPSTSGALTAAPAVLDAVNRNISVHNLPEEYINDLKQMEGIKVNVDSSNIQIQEPGKSPTQVNDTQTVHTQEPFMNSTQPNEFKAVQIEQEKRTSIDLGNTQPLKQKFSYGDQEKFLDQLDEIVKGRNRGQPSPRVSETSQTHIYENQQDRRPSVTAPVAKPRKRTSKKISEQEASTITQQQEKAPATNLNQQDNFEYHNHFVPIQVQEKLDVAQEIFNQNQQGIANFVPIKMEENPSVNVDRSEYEKEFFAPGPNDQVDGTLEVSNHEQQASETFHQDERGTKEDKVDETPKPNRRKRNDSENYQSEHEELVWQTPLSNMASATDRSESRLTTQSDDSFFDCISENGDIYDDEEKNIMKQISPHFHKNRFPYSDASETDSKSIDSENLLDPDKQISLHVYEKEKPADNNLRMDSKNIPDSKEGFAQEEVIPSQLNEKEFDHEETIRTDFRINSQDTVGEDTNNLPHQNITVSNDELNEKEFDHEETIRTDFRINSQVTIGEDTNNLPHQNITVSNEHLKKEKQDSLVEFQSLTLNDGNLNVVAENNVEPDSLEVSTEPTSKNPNIETQNHNVITNWAEIKQVKEADFASKKESKEKLRKYEETQTQNEALLLDENYKRQTISDFRIDPEPIKITYNKIPNRSQLIKLDDSGNFEDHPEKHEGKKVTFDFGNSYCQTYDVDNSPDGSELIDSTIISALTKEEGQVFMPVDNELYMRMQQNGRNKLRLNMHQQETPELPVDERSQVYQSYGVQLTPEDEMIDKIFEDSKNMDVAFLNCVDGFDLEIQNRKESINSMDRTNSNNEEDIPNQVERNSNANADENLPKANVKHDLVQKPVAQPRTLKQPRPSNQDNSNIEEHVETSIINEEEQRIDINDVKSIDSRKVYLDQNNETNATTKKPPRANIINEALIQDQSQDSLQLIDFTENNLNTKVQVTKEEESTLREDNGQDLDNFLDPENVSNNVRGDIVENGTKEYYKSRPTSNDLFNEFHISLEKYDNGQEDFSYQQESSVLNNKINTYEEINPIKQHIDDKTQQLISLEYLIESDDNTSKIGEKYIEVSEDQRILENNSSNNNEKLLTILESPLEKQETINDVEANYMENGTLKNTQNLLNTIATSPRIEKEVSQMPTQEQNTAQNNDNNEDVALRNNMNNNTEILTIQEPLPNKKDVHKENDDLEVISKSTPVSPMNRYLPQSPLGSGYVPGRKSVDLSKGLSPKPTQSKFFNRSVSHNFFPATYIRPKPVYFERFKKASSYQDDGNGMIINNNDSTPPNTQNVSETVAEIQKRLTQISKMDDVAGQLAAMEDVVVTLKRKADTLNSRTDVEYLPLLQSLFKSVRVVSGFQCNFDEKLLASQQKILKDVKKCISELSLK